MTQLLVSIIGTTSKRTARVVEQLKLNPHGFSVERLTETYKGPKYSIPLMESGGDIKAGPSRGTSVIIVVRVSAFHFQYVTHFNVIDLIVVWSFRIELFWWVETFKNSTPWWQCNSCRCFRNKRTNGCRASSTTGCFVPNVATSNRWVFFWREVVHSVQ